MPQTETVTVLGAVTLAYTENAPGAPDVVGLALACSVVAAPLTVAVPVAHDAVRALPPIEVLVPYREPVGKLQAAPASPTVICPEPETWMLAQSAFVGLNGPTRTGPLTPCNE